MRPIIKLIQYILSRKIQLNSWQALIKPWDGFCGPLEVWTHPLHPPDSGASFSSFGVFVFEIWVLRFRSRVLRFRVLGASFSRFGCFVLRSSFSSASFSKLPVPKACFLRGISSPSPSDTSGIFYLFSNTITRVLLFVWHTVCHGLDKPCELILCQQTLYTVLTTHLLVFFDRL